MEEVDNGCPMIRMGVSASEVTALWHCTICLLLLLLMYRPNQVVPDKGPLNGCVVCVCVEWQASRNAWHVFVSLRGHKLRGRWPVSPSHCFITLFSCQCSCRTLLSCSSQLHRCRCALHTVVILGKKSDDDCADECPVACPDFTWFFWIIPLESVSGLHTYRSIDLWQPRAGLHIHSSCIHSYIVTYVHRKIKMSQAI